MSKIFGHYYVSLDAVDGEGGGPSQHQEATSTGQHNTNTKTNIRALSGVRTHELTVGARSLVNGRRNVFVMHLKSTTQNIFNAFIGIFSKM
jgi:hypothetical protein